MQIIGAKGGGKGGGDAARVAVEAPDSLQSKQYARVLDLICEGEIEGLVDGWKSIYLDDTPLQAADDTVNFNGISVATREGSQAQSYIPGFEAQQSETAVGVEVTASTPVVRAIADANTNAVVVTVNVPTLTYQNQTNGDLSGYSVEIAIDIQPNGGSYVEQDLGGQEVIAGKTRSNYSRSFRLPLTGSAPWNIRVRRISPTSPGAHIQDATYWASFTAIVDAKLSHPNSALVAMSVDSAHFNSVPRRSYDMKLLKVRIPDNYNPITRAYTGVWGGSFITAWTDNPAWCFYDLLTSNRYGLGRYIPEATIDKWSLYTIGQYCDELVPDGKGSMEPRFTCNLFLQGKAAAFKVINDMASIFRGMAYWSSGSIYAVQDSPSTASAIFNQTNVIDGLFHREGSGRKARHTAVSVTWNDPADQFRQKFEYVEDSEGVARYGLRREDVVAFGCTSQGQANRVGRWILFTEKYESEVITFTAGLDASFVRPGQLAKIVDPTRSNERWGGRVVSASATSVTLDAPVTLVGSTMYTLTVVFPDGSLVERFLNTTDATVSTVYFGIALPSTDIGGAVWIITADNLEPEVVRVLAISEESKDRYKVVCVAHYEGKYDLVENDLQLQVAPVSTLRAEPAPVTNLAGSEYLYLGNGKVLVRLVISFDIGPDAAFYDVSFRRADGNIIKLPRTSSNHVEIDDVIPDTYHLRVVALSAAGVTSQPSEADYVVLGKEGINPNEPTSFVAEITEQGIDLTWVEPPDLDREDYELSIGDTYETSDFIGFMASTVYHQPPLAAGTHRFWLKTRDSSGNLSDNPAMVEVVVPAPSVVVFKDVPVIVGRDARLEWYTPATSFAIVGYDIRYGVSFELGEPLGVILSTVYQEPAKWVGARTFWIAALDSAGNVGAIGSKEITVLAPNATTITAQIIDNNVLFYWLQADRTLPIDVYELREGDTYETATVKGTKQGLFTTLLETAAGVYKYWITGIDSAGNYGTPASISATVNAPPDYVLRADIDSDFMGTLSNAFLENASLVIPVDTAETFAQHFTTNSWATPQDQIDAGFPVYIQPTEASGYYEETIDYGTLLAGSKITVTPTYDAVNSPVVAITISVKELIGDAWTDYSGAQVYATNFRYIKIRITVTSSGSDDFIRLNALNIRLDSKLRTITRSLNCLSTDTLGTRLYITDNGLSGGNPEFIDVDAISYGIQSTTQASAVYDFTDSPYPTYIDFYVFDAAGARTSKLLTVTVRGF